MESVTVASAPFESLGLVYAAQDRGFFADNGLRVTFREYDTGVAALEGVMNGEADIAAGTSEFPLVAKAFQRVPISAIASIDRPDFIYVVGRKDRGIEQAGDLKGKRIGTVPGSIAQFYLGRLLELHDMSAQDITFVDLRTPKEWRAAITDGDVDAVVLAQPEASSVKASLGSNATFFSVQGGQPAYALAISTNEWIARHPGLVKKFLTALSEAEDFVERHPVQTSAIIQKRLGLDSTYAKRVFAQNAFVLSLDQSLILAMEDEARWMIRNTLTTETAVPDLGKYLDAADLEAVHPEGVDILR